MAVLVFAVDQPALKPHAMPDRFRHDITYFCTSPGESGAPERLAPGEWWIRREDATRVHEEGVLKIVSPLDSASIAEIEISEEQEAWLAWMLDNNIERVRLA